LKIALIGFGKMGQLIQELAEAAGDQVVFIADSKTTYFEPLRNADVAIEFTHPGAGYDNVMRCLKAGVPVVSGTTGWLDKQAAAAEFCLENDGAMLVASNFSLGVNLFFSLNAQLAAMLAAFPEYAASVSETHHTAKKDAPSGTAVTLAQGIIAHHPAYDKWQLQEDQQKSAAKTLSIEALRIDPVPGTHKIVWQSDIDAISIEHVAFSRKGFASGALIAAKWLMDKKGVFSMADLLNHKP
jgi:4-hydroxy-tetrahydrodipicolinate reductase